MKTIIFIPTNRPGGIDVIENSLSLQSDLDFDLIICDEIRGRKHLWEIVAAQCNSQVTFIEPPPITPPLVRNLARAYNIAADYSLDYGYDLFISLQDYMHVNVQGVERFKEMFTRFGSDYIYTGLVSIAETPDNSEIADLTHAYSIFKTPYRRFTLPSTIQWHDVRWEMYKDYFSKGEVVSTSDVNHWEANWAAVPVELFARGLRWNNQYDYGYAFENNDFARKAVQEFGCNICIDKMNVAVSLPHFDYWPQEKEDLITHSNRERFEEGNVQLQAS